MIDDYPRFGEEMLPFDAGAKCPKCGFADIGTFFHERCWDKTCSSHPANLKRNCRRCRHFWFETPLDVVSETV